MSTVIIRVSSSRTMPLFMSSSVVDSRLTRQTTGLAGVPAVSHVDVWACNSAWKIVPYKAKHNPNNESRATTPTASRACLARATKSGDERNGKVSRFAIGPMTRLCNPRSMLLAKYIEQLHRDMNIYLLHQGMLTFRSNSPSEDNTQSALPVNGGAMKDHRGGFTADQARRQSLPVTELHPTVCREASRFCRSTTLSPPTMALSI